MAIGLLVDCGIGCLAFPWCSTLSISRAKDFPNGRQKKKTNPEALPGRIFFLKALPCAVVGSGARACYVFYSIRARGSGSFFSLAHLLTCLPGQCHA